MKIAPLCLLLLTALPEIFSKLTGVTCIEKKSRTEKYTVYRAEWRAQRYYAKCGLLRCTKYRSYYVKRKVDTRVRTLKYNVIHCCTGWRVDTSGTNCNIHNKHPTIVSCPKNKTVRATGKMLRVTWLKPEFKEPFRYGLNVTSTFGGEEAQLPWGDTKVTYVATSQNNYKQSRCAFTITVLPPMPKAVITGFVRGETIQVDEFHRLVLQCRAEYGKPPPALTWFRKGMKITIGTSYRTVNSDFLDYKHAMNTLTLKPKIVDNEATYECRTSPGVTGYSVTLNVTFIARKRIECDFGNFFPRATYTDWVKTFIQDIHGTRSMLLERMSRLGSFLLRLDGHLSSFKSRAENIVELNVTYDFNNQTMLRIAIADTAKYMSDGKSKLTALKLVFQEIAVLLRKWDGTIERLRAMMSTPSTFIQKTGKSRGLSSLAQIYTLLNSLESLMERLAGHLTITSGQIMDCRNEVIGIWDTLNILDRRYNTMGVVQPRQFRRELRIWIRAELQTIKLMKQLSKEFAAFLPDLHGLSQITLQNTLLSFRCSRKEITANPTEITQTTTVMATSSTFETMTTITPYRTEATRRRNSPGLGGNTSTLVTTTTP